MRRLIPWMLLALLPISACNAEPPPAASVAATAASPSLAADQPLQLAANDDEHAGHAHAKPASADAFTVLPRPQPTQTPGKIEVVEIFLYTCPHCYAFEPHVNAWKKKLPEDVAFVRVPASFGPTGPLLARTYYAAEALGVLEKMHPVVFDALHKQRRALNNEDDVLKLFAEHGIDPGVLRSTMHSFAVDSKVRRAQQLEVGYGITGVPAMTVNGKYGLSIAKLGEQGMLKMANQLIARERKAGE